MSKFEILEEKYIEDLIITIKEHSDGYICIVKAY